MKDRRGIIAIDSFEDIKPNQGGCNGCLLRHALTMARRYYWLVAFIMAHPSQGIGALQFMPLVDLGFL